MKGEFTYVRTDPYGCVGWLADSGFVVGVTVGVIVHDERMTVLEVHFGPPPAQLPGYPAEDVRVTVLSGGEVFAVPIGGGSRGWYHRYADYALEPLPEKSTTGPFGLELLFGALCLWYPTDPDWLRWTWRDGLGAYLRIVQRHLWCEEYARRHGSWPVEDTPHGDRPDGKSHPILTPTLRSAA